MKIGFRAFSTAGSVNARQIFTWNQVKTMKIIEDRIKEIVCKQQNHAKM